MFEIKTEGVKETIAGGGSYSINNIQSTGISFSLERVSQLSKINLNEKKILIISIGQDKKAVNLAEKIRKQSLSCSIFYGQPSKALDYANSLNIPYVIFLGKDEVKKKKIKLKDMKTGKEKLISEKELIENY